MNKDTCINCKKSLEDEDIWWCKKCYEKEQETHINIFVSKYD